MEQQQQHTSMPFFQPQEAVESFSRCSQPKIPHTPKAQHQHQLDSVEEFAIGCCSGIVGGAMSWLQLSGFSFCLGVVLTPLLLLELWEAWVLFSAARDHGNKTPSATLVTTALRKRLSRQLYGQGVIMGSAVLTLSQTTTEVAMDTSSSSMMTTGSLYISAWLGWMVLCQYSNSQPVEDMVTTSILTAAHASKRRRKVRRTGSGISMGSTDSMASSSSSRQQRRSARRSDKILRNLP